MRPGRNGNVRATLVHAYFLQQSHQNEALQKDFYAKLMASDITDIFRFVNEQCGFLSAMTPLQPR